MGAPDKPASTANPADAESRGSDRDSVVPDSHLPDTDAIDSAWLSDEAPTVRRPPLRHRDMMPTLLEEDPLQYDVSAEEANAERSRDRMPTLPDIDPLQYDVDPDDK